MPTRRGEPSTRSLLLTVLGEYILGLDGPVWSSALISSLEALGVQEKTARQALTRSGADGWLQREQVGRQVRWRLTPSTTRLLVDGADRIYGFTTVTDGWDGRWLLVRLGTPEDQREQRHHLRSRLAWTGFGSLGQGLWISPHAAQGPRLLQALATPDRPTPPMAFTTEPRGLAEDLAIVQEAWGDRKDLSGAYRAFIAEFSDVAVTDSTRSGGVESFVAQTRMVHEWRKFPFMDPGLPRQLLPDGWVGLQAAQLFSDRHRRWAGPATEWFRAQNTSVT